MFRSLMAGRTGRKVLVGLAVLAVPVTLVMVRVLPSSAAATRFEAESGTCAGTIDSNHTGFSGTGFCNTTNATGSTLSLPVSVSTAGSYSLTVHFSNGTTSDRPMSIAVNGTIVVPSQSFPVTANWDTWTDATITATLNAGSNTILFTSTTSGGGPNIDYVDVTAQSTGGGATKYEAENGVCQGTIDSNHLNFSGTGFCNTNNATGASMTWTVPSATASNTAVTFHYANGTTGSRPATVSANGTVVGTLTFPVTANWDTWADATITLPLIAGTNTIAVTSTQAGGDPNLDYLSINGSVDGTPPTVPGNPRIGPISCDSSNRSVVDFSWDASTDNVGVVFYDVFHDGQLITSVDGYHADRRLHAAAAASPGACTSRRVTRPATCPRRAATSRSARPGWCQTDTDAADRADQAEGDRLRDHRDPHLDGGDRQRRCHRRTTCSATAPRWRPSAGQGSRPPTTYPDAGLAGNTTLHLLRGRARPGGQLLAAQQHRSA